MADEAKRIAAQRLEQQIPFGDDKQKSKGFVGGIDLTFPPIACAMDGAPVLAN
jgi:hypothetical protein